ncbi:OmpW family outer membrane protein [Rhodoferax sp. GW822-FHT02A01]|uniref:OmpW/AlkL family protein n=1 Tax=Rhodoferax sp. GW822-FHT02A01 TaxID=3141537 RepID=UPI00315CDE4B
MKNKFFPLSIIAAGALLSTSGAFAQYTVQIGYANVDPGANAGATSGPFLPANTTSLNVKSQDTVFFSISRNITDNWDLQLALGLPPTHDVTLKVLNAANLPPSVASKQGQLIGTVRQIAPTLFANYKFGESTDKFRPFVGIGINYTMFDQANSAPLFNQLSGGTTNNKLTDSWGLAAQVGATYKLDGPWSISGTWSTADVKSTLTNNTYGIERKTDIKFSPSVLILSVGYAF